MKKHNRLLAMLMALAMVFTFMPAMAFAEDDLAVEELTAVEEEILSSEAMNDSSERPSNGQLKFTLMDNGTAEVYFFDVDNPDIFNLTSITIPAYVSYNGVTYTVTSLDYEALCGSSNLKSVTVPATVTNIGKHALGYDYDGEGGYTKVAGFTIFGTNGTAAQTYANENGILFRDPNAEAIAAAEAARQGTPDGRIPKVKVSKHKAGKKSATVKWKKFNKKQLKKSKATHYEIWACANTGFATGETSEHIIKKSKSGLKIKKMPKGTYYIKVRAIRQSGGVKYVGPWSKVKKVKVK